MKNRLAFVFKIFMIIALCLFVGIAIFAGVVWARWPLWVCFFIGAGVLGIFLGLVFLRKLLMKRKEQKFVSQIIEQDNAALKSADKKDQELSREMQAKWKEAMEALKKSHLKHKGNPLYVLPWYMIIGGSGTGKTTAIKSAKLSSSFAEVGSVSGISGTRNCDWWFFEQAILIDTAGRYAVSVDDERDRDEWQKFLGLLARYRKKEPLNGLIVTVSADSLNDMGVEGLESYGRDIRKRLDELMRVLDAKFPVYIMVTKCDLVQGMTHFSDCFSDEVLGQTMGIVNHGLEKDAMGLVSDCFKTVGERLRDVRLLLIQKLERQKISPELMIFPSELEKIRPGFEAFIKGVFQENPYQETPFFRGIYFSSGRQEGTPFSHFLKDLGVIGEQEVLPGTSRGLFLHDFFSRLLPSDRGLFTVTQRGAAWKRLTRNIGFAAWTAMIIAVCGVLSFSFVKNLHTIKKASAQFAGPNILQGEVITDISILEQFNQTIQTVERSNGSWWIPRLGLDESLDVEVALKKKYCTLLEKRFIAPFDKQMMDKMAYFSPSTPVDQSIRHVDHLVKRISLMKARLLQRPVEELAKMEQPVFNTVEIGAGQDIAEEIQLKIKDLYLYYLVWQGETQTINQKMNDLQKWLARVLSIKGASLNWLVVKTNSDPGLAPYTLADFWGKSGQETGSMQVDQSFTLKGKQRIDGFVREIEAALTDPLILAGQKREFYKWYEKAYVTGWLNFIAEFDDGKKYLKAREQWQNIATIAGHKKGPYFSLLGTINEELAPFFEGKDLPEWMNLIRDLNNLNGQAATLRAQKAGSTGVIGQAASAMKSKLASATRTGGVLNTRLDAEGMMKAGKLFMTYQDALDKIIPSVSSQRAAFDFAASIYTEDPATSKMAFFVAHQSVNKLKGIVVYPGKTSQYVWNVFQGPLSFYQDYALQEASCQLQKKWEETVLMEMKDVSDKKNINTLLLGPEGVVTNFLKGPGKPFIKRGLKKGFYSAKVNEKSMAFDPYFFKFLTRGVSVSKPAKSNYNVKISGYPTSANGSAQVQPHATVLELICADDTSRLENRNYPVRKIFSWSPQSDCDVAFKIKIGSLVLVKKYTGSLSFPKFLKDFSKGQHRFVPADFPDAEDDLKRMKVKFIKVKYGFKGNEPVARLLSAVPGKTPMEIVRCWD